MDRLSPTPLAFAAGGLPILAVMLCYALSASHGQVPWCNPFIDSCTSISATGRHPPAYFVFKALVLPAAGLMTIYWTVLVHWLDGLSPMPPKRRGAILVCGLVAAVALILYATVLGAVGTGFQLQRRIGIILFFGLTAIAHLLAATLQIALPEHQRPPLSRLQLALSAVLLVGGLGNSLLSLTYADFEAIEDAIEWWFAAVMMSQFLITGEIWRRAGFLLQGQPHQKS